MSNTPETDAETFKTMRGDDKYGWRWSEGVPADFARKIERERDAAREAFAIATDQLVQVQSKLRETRAALQRLADCDWVITPHDRMDAVRKIARDALEANQ